MTKQELLSRLGPFGMDDEVQVNHWDGDEIGYSIESVDGGPDGPVLIIVELDEEPSDGEEG